jgi:Txe/YoeB family toxin of toxin-antitoxin system
VNSIQTPRAGELEDRLHRAGPKRSKKIAAPNLKAQTQRLLDIFAGNPFENPPPYEKLAGDMVGAISQRINIQHRLIYQVYSEEQTVKVIRMWTHYE